MRCPRCHVGLWEMNGIPWCPRCQTRYKATFVEDGPMHNTSSPDAVWASSLLAAMWGGEAVVVKADPEPEPAPYQRVALVTVPPSVWDLHRGGDGVVVADDSGRLEFIY